MHKVVITGLGMSTSLGPDLPACWEGLHSGRNGIAPITFWDASNYSTKVAAEVHHVPAESGSSSMPRAYCRRSVRLFHAVAREAFSDGALDTAPIPSRQIGLAVGASVNYLDMRRLQYLFRFRRADESSLDMERLALESDSSHANFFRGLGDSIAMLPARLLKLGGPALIMDTACAASAHAVGQAFRMIRRGKIRAMIAGGSAALVTPLHILAFALLGALSKNPNPAEASRPFDKLRDGFVMGEGAGAVLLESLESARERGARIYAEVAGFGSNLNAYNLTDPSPDGAAESRAIQLALSDGALVPEEVDYVAAHGTSTPKNDLAETKAIKQVFGKRSWQLRISSNKGQIGHTLSAAGVINLIAAVKAISERVTPPTMHLRNPDPECDLDYVVNESRPGKIEVALANSFGFGGQNAVLAVRALS
jgi:3-oxoacyl-[acyl-carrier-protein] synthase II